MFKRFTAASELATSATAAVCFQRRGARYANLQEALRAPAGQSAGQISILNEICCNPDAEEERRKPVFRQEVAPSPSGAGASYQRTMYQWGYDSLTLFKKTNEDPGPWWNANSSTLVSNWSQVGDTANAGMWSGVWRYTYGVGEYNLRPFELRGRAWGRKDAKSGAVRMPFDAPQQPLQQLVFPHTPEHQQHRRLKQPMNSGFKEVSTLHGKRILREIQYHLGQGLRFYMVDGVFGSHPETATPYRIITDNPTHAYFATMAALRKFNYVAQQEIMLVKRVGQSPIDEWAWRRPGVLIYHAPCFDFEAPRIVEEFGGPRPADMSLESNHFVAVEPYSIPMKAVLAGEPSCDTLLDVTAALCARWGFYADDKGFVTVTGDSLLSPDGKGLTLVMGSDEALLDTVRTSPHLYGSRHHRIANGAVSRAWDVVSLPGSAAAAPNDIIEEHNNRVQRGLPLRLGVPAAQSHRQFGRRHVSEFGFKWPHNYTEDGATKAFAGGHLFGRPAHAQPLIDALPRPAAIPLASTDVVVIGEGSDAAAAALQVFRERSFLYGEEPALLEALQGTFRAARSVKVVPAGEARSVLQGLGEKGQL
eukprot:gene4875-3496_t